MCFEGIQGEVFGIQSHILKKDILPQRIVDDALETTVELEELKCAINKAKSY